MLLVFGTNYFHYATLEAGNAHIYLFFLYALVLYNTVQWYQKVTWANSIAIGICIGLAMITRPIDIFICLISLCWQPANTFKLHYLQQHGKYIIAIIICACIICFPQLLYWKHVTSHWVYYSYSIVDYFEWTRIRIWHGLFGYRKGWFVYTPIALIAFLQMIGGKLPVALKFYKSLFWVYFIPMLYIVFSWHNWFYGWGFSCRALIGVLPLLAIPLAAFIQNVLQSSGIKKNIFTTVLITLVAYNAFQTWQYEHGIINGTLMNKTTYWKIFLQTKQPVGIDADFKLQEELDWKNGY